VLGIAGGEQKCRWLTETLGLDWALDYKAHESADALSAAIKDRAGGVDVYFDNVGGDIFEAVLFNMKPGGRLVACGVVSAYDADPSTGVQAVRGVPAWFISRRLTLRAHCPDGVNVYFDNVGGDILDIVLAQLARLARVVLCGAISQYNNTTPIKGPSNYLSLLVNRARMEGIIVFDYASRYPEAVRDIAGWMAAGKLKSREDIVDGLQTFPETLLKLFSGENFGKLVLRVAER
jgi:NADPH-dependent curcumin reductase CurA